MSLTVIEECAQTRLPDEIANWAKTTIYFVDNDEKCTNSTKSVDVARMME